MILVDTGPLFALFAPADGSHACCIRVLQSVDEPVATTIPVLTEASHLLTPGSTGAERLMDFISESGLTVWPWGRFNERWIARSLSNEEARNTIRFKKYLARKMRTTIP